MYCSYSQYSQYLGHQYCSYSKYSEYLGHQHSNTLSVLGARKITRRIEYTRSICIDGKYTCILIPGYRWYGLQQFLHTSKYDSLDIVRRYILRSILHVYTSYISNKKRIVLYSLDVCMYIWDRTVCVHTPGTIPGTNQPIIRSICALFLMRNTPAYL